MIKAVKYLFAGLFVLGAIVQLNDPDPIAWLTIYAVAAVLCIRSVFVPRSFLPPFIVGILSLAWCLTLVPAVVGNIPFADMFGAWEMKNVGIEKSREMYGLLFIAAAMFLVAGTGYRASKAT